MSDSNLPHPLHLSSSSSSTSIWLIKVSHHFPTLASCSRLAIESLSTSVLPVLYPWLTIARDVVCPISGVPDAKVEEQPQEQVHVDPASLKAPRVYVGNLAFSVGWQDLKGATPDTHHPAAVTPPGKEIAHPSCPYTTSPLLFTALFASFQLATPSHIYVSPLSVRFVCVLRCCADFFREAIGEVSRVEIISYPSGRSKGCAIVEFANMDDAARAINECSNQEIAGRKIFLREDREEKGFSTRSQPFAPQPYGGGGGGGGYAGGRGGGYVGGGAPYQRGPSIYNTRGGFAPRGGGRGGYGGGGGGGGYAGDGAGGAAGFQPRGPPPPTGNNDGTQVYIGNLPWRTSWQELKDLGAQYGEVHRADVAADRFTGRSKGFGTLKFGTPETAQAAIEALNDSEFQGRKIVARLDNYA